MKIPIKEMVGLNRSSRQLDMTSGPLFRQVLLFALPICIGNILQQLYSTVDTLVISNFCGTDSLAAVGTSSQPVEVLLCLFMGLGSGISILVAQYVGAKDGEQLSRIVNTACRLLYLCALPLTLIGCLLGPAILKLRQVPSQAMAPAISYIRILFLGTLGNLGYNINAGILRGLGNSRSTLLFLIISCAINIVLDLFFVSSLRMDTGGAALATIIAQFVSWIVSSIYLMRRFPEVKYSLQPGLPDKKSLITIVKIALPLGFNGSVYSIGHIVLQLLINTQGAVFMAACSVAGKVTGLANVAINSLSSAATTYSGQNYGAGLYSRLRRGALRIPAFSGLLTLFLGLTVTFFARPILGIFHPEQEVLDLAVRYIRVVSPFFWLYAVFSAVISYIHGLGVIRFPTWVNILMLWLIRIPTSILIVHYLDGLYVMAAYPISFASGLIAILFYFVTPGWKKILHKADSSPSSQV